MTDDELAAIVLAAGEGTRMKSALPKVLHEVAGRAMVDRMIDALEEAGVTRIVAVTGFGRERVDAHLAGRARCVEQADLLGTGHAVQQAAPALEGYEGLVMVTCGDTPLWRAETLASAVRFAREGEYAGVVLTTEVDDPTSYGRIVRDGEGSVKKIVEERDATEEEKRVREINSGAFCFRSPLLFWALARVGNDNDQKQYYLTDVVEILIGAGHRVGAFKVADPEEAMGVNSPQDLAAAEAALRGRKSAADE